MKPMVSNNKHRCLTFVADIMFVILLVQQLTNNVGTAGGASIPGPDSDKLVDLTGDFCPDCALRKPTRYGKRGDSSSVGSDDGFGGGDNSGQLSSVDSLLDKQLQWFNQKQSAMSSLLNKWIKYSQFIKDREEWDHNVLKTIG
ncbi:uncharacterized protein LOC128956199 [Oppia nitens]|uniref:uncharacterized protein LOC128956199 n=1 Tax=Oppia nitens TaxID=1686743 RepID=UPI0023DAC690|nr:uncharacterized protein LOC128956199 [Oppia nitens]